MSVHTRGNNNYNYIGDDVLVETTQYGTMEDRRVIPVNLRNKDLDAQIQELFKKKGSDQQYKVTDSPKECEKKGY